MFFQQKRVYSRKRENFSVEHAALVSYVQVHQLKKESALLQKGRASLEELL